MAILPIPTLLSKLIFSRPVVKWWIHIFLWNSYFVPTLRAQHLVDQVMADLSLIKWQFHRFLLWQLTFHDSSYFIPTLRAQIFGRPGLGRSTANQMAILTIPALLSKLIFSRPVVKWWIHIFLWNSYFVPTLRAQHLVDQVMADLSLIKWQFHRFLLWQLTSHDSSYFIPTLRAQHLADQVLAYLPPHPMVISQIPALTAHYSESSTFGRPGLGRCNPHIRWQFHRFLLYPESLYLADQVLADQPPIIWKFHRFLLYSESSYLADPLSNGDFTYSCEIHISFLLWELNIWQTSSWQM